MEQKPSQGSMWYVHHMQCCVFCLLDGDITHFCKPFLSLDYTDDLPSALRQVPYSSLPSTQASTSLVGFQATLLWALFLDSLPPADQVVFILIG
jgi:hypothetical protein